MSTNPLPFMHKRQELMPALPVSHSQQVCDETRTLHTRLGSHRPTSTRPLLAALGPQGQRQGEMRMASPNTLLVSAHSLLAHTSQSPHLCTYASTDLRNLLPRQDSLIPYFIQSQPLIPLYAALKAPSKDNWLGPCTSNRATSVASCHRPQIAVRRRRL